MAPPIRSAGPPARKAFYAQLYVQVLTAIALGVAVGYLYPGTGEALKPLGDAFIKLVKMIIAPVIFLTVTTGIAGMNDLKKVGRVAGKAMIYFLTFSSLALIVGLIVANVVQPGSGLDIDPASLDGQAVQGYVAKVHDQSVTGFLMNIIPSTIVGAFAEGNILQVLFFSILFGSALAMAGDTGKPVLSLLQALLAPVFKLVGILMQAAPVGAFGAMAFTIGKYGIGSVANLAMLVATFYFTAFVFVFGILGAVCRYNGFSIFSLVRYIKEELLLVLATSSSEGCAALAHGENGEGRRQAFRRGSRHPDGIFLQSGRYQYLYDACRPLHRPGNEHAFVGCRSDSPVGRRDAFLEGCRRYYGGWLRHVGRHAFRNTNCSRCWDGSDPWCGPLHVRMPSADECSG